MTRHRIITAAILLASCVTAARAQQAAVGVQPTRPAAAGIGVASELQAPIALPGAGVERSGAYLDFADTAYALAGLRYGAAEGGAAFVVRSSDGENAEIAETVADLAVMSRIIKKTLGAHGIGDVPRAYLEGYGPVFSLSVSFAVAPPRQATGVEPRETDRLWREAEAELWGIEKPKEAAPYDAERAQALTDAAVNALRYARNIRHLPDDSVVTVIIAGGRNRSASTGAPGWVAWPRPGQAEPSRVVVSAPLEAIRAFAAGDIVSNQFRRRATVKASAPSDSDLAPDVAILARILDKALRGKLGDAYGGASSAFDAFAYARLLGGRGGATASGAVIDGYGVLLQTEVRLPVAAPARAPEKDAPEDDASLWKRTQLEIAGLLGGREHEDELHVAFPLPTHDYSVERVDDIQNALVDVLKEAANIQGLAQDQAVAIVVHGGGAPTGAVRWDSGGSNVYHVLTSGGRATVLTAHVTKGDIDRYASGAITREAFRARVTFNATLAGGATGHGPRISTDLQMTPSRTTGGLTPPEPDAPVPGR